MAHAGKLWTRGLVAAAVVAVGGGAAWVVWRQPAVQMALLSRASLNDLKQRTAVDANDWRTQYWLGKRAAEAGDFAEAEPALRAAFGTAPSFLPAATELGKVLVVEGRVDEAYQVLRMVVGRDPSQRDARLALARLYRTQAAYPHATEMLEGLIRENPRDPMALYELAVCQGGEQRYADAEKTLEAALKLDGRNPLVLTALSRVHRILGRPEAAEPLARKAVKLRPDYVLARLELARAVSSQQPFPARRAEALEVLKEAQKVSPGNPDVLFEAGRLLVAEGRWKDAAEALSAAIRAAPRMTDAYFFIAQAYRHLGRHEESRKAEAVFKRLKEHEQRLQDLYSRLGAHPESADLRFQIGELHASFGELAPAIGAYRIGLQRDPENPKARRRLSELVRLNLARGAQDDPAP